MLHAMDRRRAFNTPLLVEPLKAMRSWRGLGRVSWGGGSEFLTESIDCPEKGVRHSAARRASFWRTGCWIDYHQHARPPSSAGGIGIAVIEMLRRADSIGFLDRAVVRDQENQL